ncbi:MAG: hypothetical protein ACLVK8_09575 [Ruminococcus sp.]
MALDGAYLHAVRQELLPLIDARIEKIHQPTREELIVAPPHRRSKCCSPVRQTGRVPHPGRCRKSAPPMPCMPCETA